LSLLCLQFVFKCPRRRVFVGYFRDPKRVEHLDRDDDLAALRDRDDYRAFRKTFKPAVP
jgi:hypothetical protein